MFGIDKWLKVTLNDVAEEISIREENPSTSGYDRFVGLEHFVSGEFVIRNYGRPENLVSAMKVCNAEDILLARRNVYLKRAAMVNFDALCSGDAIVLRKKAEILYPQYLPLILNTDHFWQYANANANGSMSKRINVKTLMKYEFLLPSYEEQRRIAELLWAADKVIESKRKLLAAIITVQNIEINSYFSAENVERNSWPIVPLSSATTMQTGITLGKSYTGELNSYPYLRVANVKDGYLDLKEVKVLELPHEKSNRYLLQKDDYLMTEGGDLDKVGRGTLWNCEIQPCLHQNHVFCIRANKDSLLPRFLAYITSSLYGKSYFLKCAKKTSNLASINSTQVKAFPLILPSINEQVVFIEKMDYYENAKVSTQEDISRLQLMLRKLINDVIRYE
ncbi:restriction endonuclease subunit S [Paenibacillus sp. OAE614]|uniref:restriction endonuclease subunit S n=1 Tax=Paenibacillus sp. OAE614 TaxID=2663804 RepID=UPI00178956F3